ncbi:7827_t:CDS:2, partial [Funneliformis geosporum]
TTSEALDAFDKIFEYLKQDDNQDLFVGSEESNKSNDTYSNLVETERNHEEDKYQLDQNILGHW